MADSDKYFNSVTIVKAIGIILMVFAHAINDPSTPGGYFYIHRFIYAFHMPLFFIMSGFCFKEKYLDNTILFITQKIKGIYIPFFVFLWAVKRNVQKQQPLKYTESLYL